MMRQWIIWYAIVLHLWWAGLCLLSAAPLATVPLAGLDTMNRLIAAVLFAIAASLAMTSILTDTPGAAGFALLIPQQFLLTLSAFAAIGLIVAGHYADGVIRPRAFIAADQAPFIFSAVFHSGAVIEHYGPPWSRIRRWIGLADG